MQAEDCLVFSRGNYILVVLSESPNGLIGLKVPFTASLEQPFAPRPPHLSSLGEVILEGRKW